MRITRIKLTNFGPHRRWELNNTGDKSIVEIIGLNGSGKSHILHALKYAFTGDLTGKTESYITSGEKNGEVLVEFEKEGIKGIITRTLNTPTKRSFKWGDEAPLTAAGAVDKKMEEVLGADKQTILNAVFIEQGEIAGLLADTASQRIAIFSKLLNLHFLDKRLRNVDGWLDKLKSGVRDLRPAQDQLKVNKDTTLKNLENEGKMLDSLNSKCGGIDAINKFLECFADYEGQLKNCEQVAFRQQQLMHDLQDTANDKDNDSTWEEYLDELRSEKQQHDDSLAKITSDIAAAKNSKQVLENVKRFLKDQETYFQTVSKVEYYKKMFKDESPSRAKELHNAALNLVAERDNLATSTAKLAEVEKGIPDKTLKKQSLNDSFDSNQKEIKELEKKIEFSKNVRSNLSNFLDAKKKLKDKLSKETVICPSCGLKLLSGQEITDAALQEQQAQIDFFTAEISSNESKLEALSRNQAKLRSDISFIERDIALSEADIKHIKDSIQKSQGDIDRYIAMFPDGHRMDCYLGVIDNEDIKGYDYAINYALPHLSELMYPGKFPEGFVGNVTMDGEKYVVEEKDLSEESIESKLKELYETYDTTDKALSDLTTKIVTIEHLLKEVKEVESNYKKLHKALETHPFKHELPIMSQKVMQESAALAVDVKDELNRLKEQFIQITAVINSHKATLQDLEKQEQELQRLENENLKTYEAIAELEKIKTLIRAIIKVEAIG